MDRDIEIATLVLEYLKVLVWPLTVLVLAGMFENEFLVLIRRMTKWNVPGFSAEFAEAAERVEESTERVLESHKEPILEPPGVGLVLNSELKRAGLQQIPGAFDFGRYRRLANSDPNLALAGLRIDLEIMLRNLATAFDVEHGERRSAGSLVRLLQTAGALKATEVQALHSILEACNRAVHGGAISSEDAYKVLDSGETLINFLADTAMTKIIQQ